MAAVASPSPDPAGRRVSRPKPARLGRNPRRAAGTQRLWAALGVVGQEVWRPLERRAAEAIKAWRAREGGLGTQAVSAASLGHGAAQIRFPGDHSVAIGRDLPSPDDNGQRP
uniref:Uncharacterized protein n=1 Tax=Pongo abelii TaxID=9601 RepID=A0A8I5T9S3_PONAB